METQQKKKRSKRKLLLLGVLLPLLVGAVGATAYAVLEWQLSMTVVANPDVCFFAWAGGAKANNFTYTVNIFPNIITIDENVTYGVWEWSGAIHTVYFKLASETTNSSDVLWAYFKVYNATGTLHSSNETNFDAPTTTWSAAESASANEQYTIQIQVKANATATTGHTPSITYQMKVDDP